MPIDDRGGPRGWRWLAWAWLAVVLAVALHQVRFWQTSDVDTDVLALLPQDAHDPLLAQATNRIADQSARNVVVLLGAGGADGTRAAQAAFEAALRAHAPLPIVADGSMRDWFGQAESFYGPWRNRLLTAKQRRDLQSTPVEDLVAQALASLYAPVAGPRLTGWRDDPLGLWPQWWQQRAAAAGLRMDENGLLLADGRTWAVLQFRTRNSAFSLDGTTPIADALDAADAAARKAVPDLIALRAGVPLHAEAAAARANFEINTIGWGSLAAVLLLVWFAFGSLRPILLVGTSLLVGCAVALTVTVLVFGKIHLLTLVFGASLVGVAEDYGIHWFGSRQGAPQQGRWSLLRHLLPGLSLALLTSALAYLALGVAPFPGLRQMAVFSVAGLAAAFLTVVLWFPWLDRGAVRTTRFARWLGASLVRWPRLDHRPGLTAWAVFGVLVLLVVGGLARLRTSDDLRGLQSSPAALMHQQIEAGRLLGLPSPAQFFLVRGRDAEQVLQREEALTGRLQVLRHEGRGIAGYQSFSDWVPSQARQGGDAALTARVEPAVLDGVGKALGEVLERPGFSGSDLLPSTFLAAPVSVPFRHLWLGALGTDQASVVMVATVPGAGSLDAMRAVARGLPGVHWVDRTADFSAMLGHYRRMMSGLLLAGIVLVYATMVWRYRARAWRVMVPTLVAGVLTVALLGWLGEPLQLFNVLALLLLLGMGIDYGIFLLEHDGDASAWLSVCVGAASTWLSFGLLALSTTPALRSFGLTLLLGIGVVWLVTPLFRPVPSPFPHPYGE